MRLSRKKPKKNSNSNSCDFFCCSVTLNSRRSARIPKCSRIISFTRMEKPPCQTSASGRKEKKPKLLIIHLTGRCDCRADLPPGGAAPWLTTQMNEFTINTLAYRRGKKKKNVISGVNLPKVLHPGKHLGSSWHFPKSPSEPRPAPEHHSGAHLRF